MERKNAWAKYDEAGMEKIEAFAKKYCAFLDHGKTERECVAQAVKAAQDAGFMDLKHKGRPPARGGRQGVRQLDEQVVHVLHRGP